MVTLRYQKLTDCTNLGCIFIAGCLVWVFASRFVQGSLTSGPSSFAKWATEQNWFATITKLGKLLKLVNCFQYIQYYSTLRSNYQTIPRFGRLDYGFIPSRFGDLYFTNSRGKNICVVVFITLVLVGPSGFRDIYFHIVSYIRSESFKATILWMKENQRTNERTNEWMNEWTRTDSFVAAVSPTCLTLLKWNNWTRLTLPLRAGWARWCRLWLAILTWSWWWFLAWANRCFI